jgi:hypothetical protein
MDIAQASTMLHQSQLQHEVGMRVLGMALDNAGLDQDLVQRMSVQATGTVQSITDPHLGTLLDTYA